MVWAKNILAKKCVNYYKSNSQQNSVKVPTDPISTKNFEKVNKVSKCAKKWHQKAKSQHYSLSRQNSVKFYKAFTKDRIFFSQTLFARSYTFYISALYHFWNRCSEKGSYSSVGHWKMSRVYFKVVQYSRQNVFYREKKWNQYALWG